MKKYKGTITFFFEAENYIDAVGILDQVAGFAEEAYNENDTHIEALTGKVSINNK